ncbi:MAG: lamin tail domain-containing protein [Verrucomicrobiota bacterium]
MKNLRRATWWMLLAGVLGARVMGQVVLTEFLASNGKGLVDADGDRPDWVELWNGGTAPVNLQGWSLTDDAGAPRKWVFPTVTLPPGAYLVVFASGKNRTNNAAPLHTSFSLSADGEYLALFPPEGPAATEFAPSYPSQRADISYGTRAGQAYYFNPPTPGAANAGGVGDFVADTKFSVDRGVFDQPFDLAITCATAGATIRYTTSGAPPTAITGTVYGGPVRVSRTTVMRAAAFKAGLQPSDVDTQTYLFLGDVIRQSPTGAVPWPEWPTPGSQSQTYNYGMDPRIVDSPTYAAQIVPALKALPSFSLVTTLSNLFDGATGIFSNPGQDGRDWERAASLELIFPDGRTGFQADCGVRIRGGFSRSTGNPKHAFRFFFREAYGVDKLRFPLHAGGVEEFDALDLRTFQNYSWSFDPGDGSNGVFIRDVFSRDTQLAMGQQGERGNYYHLYINGVYWGIFNSCERPEANFGSAYFGGRPEDYDVIKVEAGPYAINATDGTLDAWTRLYNQCKAITASNAETTFWRVQGRNPDGTPNAAYENLLEIDNLIDYMLVIVFGGNLDAPISNFLGNTRPNNWYGLRNRTGAHGGFRFISHDAEHTLLDINQNRVGPFAAGNDSVVYSNPQYLWQRLWQSPSFRLRVADRVQRHFFNQGALTAAAARDRFAARTNQLFLPVVAESARWGDSKTATPLTRDGHWLPAANRILNAYLPSRGNIVLGQLRAANLFPVIAAPSMSPFGGIVAPGSVVTLANPGVGFVVFTSDGSDPRALSGAESAASRRYTDPIALRSARVIKARVHRVEPGIDEWSPLVEATFHVRQDVSGLRFSEIHYRPAADPSGAFTRDEFEFVELRNIGSSAVELSGFRFIDGIGLEFPMGTLLEGGSFLVLAENRAAFTNRYAGVAPDFVYTGQLSNTGERLALADPAGGLVMEVAYGVGAPWPAGADGLGFSLVPTNPIAQPGPGDAAAWRASSRVGGSPGAEDVSAGILPVIVNEVLAHTDPPALDAVELFNPNPVVAPVGGWWLTDDPSRPAKYRIPAGTQLPPGGWLVLDESAFHDVNQGTNAFRLSSLGDQVYLLSADTEGRLTGHVDGVSFGASFNGETFVRWTNSSGHVSMVRSAAPTLGAANSPPEVPPVVLQEIHYAPGPGELPFVELWNRSGLDVPLFDPANPDNTWGVSGIDFAFPRGFVLASGAHVVIAGTDPGRFRQAYGLPASVVVLGPWQGTLQSDGELLRLQKPDGPTTVTLPSGAVSVVVPRVTVDEARYDGDAPWPIAAGLGGVPLERRAPTSYGNDPNAWRAATGGPTPGAAAGSNRSPRVSAGPDREWLSAAFPLPVALEGWATDDGLPEPTRLSGEWTQVSGPRGVVFRAPGASNGVVELPGQGTYVLRWRASDGERDATDDVQLTVARPGEAATLVSFGSTWRYFDQRQDLGSAWRERTFADTGWKTGKARLGYGGDGEVTTIAGGSILDRIPTAYFRLRFNVPSAAAVKDLKVQLIRDDGGVVYLNGAEVMRSAMPEGAIAFGTFASQTMGGADETTPVEGSVSPALLVDGDNVLAVEIHQVNRTSSDLGFDLALQATVLGANAAPTAKAPASAEIRLPGVARLVAGFTDDGLPALPGVPTFSWSTVSGPGTVTFDPPDSPATSATFGAPGTYVLRFTVHDGARTASDTVTVVARAAVSPPVLSMLHGPPPVLRLGTQAGVAYSVRWRTRLVDGSWETLSDIPAGDARTVEIPIPSADDTRFIQVIAGP